MSGWPVVPLGSFANMRNGLNFNATQVGVGTPVVGVSDFKDNVVASFNELDEVDTQVIKSDDDYLQQGDILFVRSNGNRQLIGRSMYIVDQPKKPTSHSGFTIRCRIQSDEYDSRFYAYLLRGPLIRETLSAHGGGTNISNLNQQILSSLELPVPTLPIQKRIAGILSAYDDLIAVNERRIAILEEMARRIFEDFCSDETPAERLSSIADVNSETLRPKSAPDQIRYIDIASVSPGKIENIKTVSFKEAPSRARRVVRDGDILWSCVRPNRRSRALVLDPQPNTIASTGFAVLRAVEVPFSWLLLATTTDDFANYLTNRATGAAYPAVKAADFEDAEIPLPNKSRLEQFESTVTPMLRFCSKLVKQNTNLRTTRDLLLPRLISGEIDVSEAPLPETVAAE